MAKEKKLAYKFYYGDSLKVIRKNTEGLFPLYITLRYGDEKTNIKSISATYGLIHEFWPTGNSGPLVDYYEKLRNKLIEDQIPMFINKDKAYLNKAFKFYKEVFPNQPFNLKFISNQFIQQSLNTDILRYFEHLISDDVSQILKENQLFKINDYILPSVRPFVLIDCLKEISKEVRNQIMNNDQIRMLFQREKDFFMVSFLDFYYMDLVSENLEMLVDVQIEFKSFLKEVIRDEKINLLAEVIE